MAAHRDNDVRDKVFKVSRENLLASLKKNREAHKAEWETALKGWEVEYEERLRKFTQDVTGFVGDFEGDAAAHYETVQVPRFHAPERPQHHLEDYDLMIRGLELSVDAELELTLAEIDRYDRDNWDWVRQFKAMSMNYAGKVAFGVGG